MHIQADSRDDYTVLHLRGEFDTYYCPLLQKEVDELITAGEKHVVLNLRLVKFINSTALGAIIKASKALTAQGGQLALSRPSSFVRDVIQKVGLNRVVPVFDSDEEAGHAIGPSKDVADETDSELSDAASVLFTLLDEKRIEHFVGSSKGRANPVHGHKFGKNWRGIGRMASLGERGMAFTWNGGNTGLSPFEMGQLLALGTELKVKFRMPLLARGHFEAMAAVTSLEERDDGVKVSAEFSDLDEETKKQVRQYADDMAFLKRELRNATESS